MKIYGVATISLKTGLMGKTLHKSIDCLSLRWSDWINITDKDLAGKLKKCKKCFKENT